MAFALYSRTFWFPDGSLAAGIPARIFPENSNALAPIFTDITGTIPLPNPLNTDGAGVLTFWAEEGEYWIHIDTESFRVSVGNPNGLDVFDGASLAISTGLMSGGSMAPNGVSVDFGETVGYVVDYTTDSFRPSLTRVDVPAQTVALDGPALARTVTWWLLDATGAFVQQALPPTNIQRRTHIVLGFSILIGGVVAFTKAVPTGLPQPMNQTFDLMEGLGTFRISGAVASPNGANLSINMSAGTLFSRGFGVESTPNDPHVAPVTAQAPALFREATQTTTVFPLPDTFLDVANYDVGGVITPIPGGANASTIRRVFAFAQAAAADQLLILYGQTVYANLTAAVNGIGAGTFVVNPQLGNTGALVGYIAVTKTATDLSDPTQAIFVNAPSKFATP